MADQDKKDVEDIVASSDDSVEETDRRLMKGGKSIITDKKDENRRLMIVTFAVMSGAASYIMMLFLAMPVSIHLLVNQDNGCNPETDLVCFAPSSESQTQLTLTLTLLRLFTFMMGSFVGNLSDVYGRRPMLILALLGYATTAVFFLIGWRIQNVNMFLIGAIILGASSPITPHGVAYVSDISRPDKLAGNLGILQGIGYFCGLMVGAIVGLGISLASLENEEETGSAGIEAYDKLFYYSYGAGLLLSGSSAVIMMLFLPESLHKDERVEKLDIKKANPLGFIYMVSRQPFIFNMWLAAFFAWMAVGAGESVTGGWWLRRYVKTELTDFITFVVILWTVSGVGSVVMTKVYVSTVGVKGGLHISAVFTFAVGLAFAFSPTANASYSAVVVSFFASPIYAIILAVLMGQVGALEKGALAGALRSSEALGKLIGIVAFGNSFATYIENYRPDQSCVPLDYSPSNIVEIDGVWVELGNPSNTCECGVETCPDIRFSGDPSRSMFYPSNCTLGALTATFHGKHTATYSVEDAIKARAENLQIQPGGEFGPGQNAFVAERSEECQGSGLSTGLGGFETDTNSLWCVAADPSDFGLPLNGGIFPEPLTDLVTSGYPRTILGLGCTGFNLNLLSLYAEVAQNPNATDLAQAAGGALSQSSLTIEQQQRVTQIILSGALLTADELDALNEYEDLCPPDELNICMRGPLTSFPGLFPFLYLFVISLVSYFFILVAEFAFISHDQKFWKSVEEEGVGETHIVGQDVASPKE